MPVPPADFESRIAALDLTLFDGVPTQSLRGDRRAWLAVQRAVRRASPGYTYLEIGSHLGGSVQQHLLDPQCARIISIDKRPASQPDDRGQTFYYEENTTTRMMASLGRLSPDGVKKVHCFESDAAALTPEEIGGAPAMCFIDGEHTTRAALSDFHFCLSVCAPDAVICFHDDWIVRDAIAEAMRLLDERRIPFTPRKLGGVTFGLFLRTSAAAGDEGVGARAYDAHRWSVLAQTVGRMPRSIQPLLWAVLARAYG
jgi:hypothetical protein